MASRSASFSSYDVFSHGGRPQGPEVEVTLNHDGTAVGQLLFYSSEQLPATVAEVAAGAEVLVLKYPTTRFPEVYRLLRDGAHSIVVSPTSNSGSVLAAFPSTS